MHVKSLPIVFSGQMAKKQVVHPNVFTPNIQIHVQHGQYAKTSWFL